MELSRFINAVPTETRIALKERSGHFECYGDVTPVVEELRLRNEAAGQLAL